MPPKNLILIFSNSEQMFGEVLSKEQLPLINSYTQNGLQFIQEMREFMKERSAIEREYSQRLEALAKRHLKQKDRIGSLITVQGELPASESGDSRKPTAVSYGSMFGAWESLLQQTEEIAKTRLAMSDKLITAVSDQFKGLAIRVDESRRKHVAFSAKLNESRDKAYADKDRNKERYDQSCEAVEASKQRLEKCADEKAQEKFRKQLEQDTEEMNNVKNSYLMSISVANAFKKRFYYQDVPKLMNDMQQLNHRLVKTTQRLWEQFATYELTALSKVQDHVNSILLVVREIDAVADTDSFARMHAKPWTEPYDFAFEPTLLWKDSDELVSDQASKICLNNKLGKIDEKLAEIDKEIVGKTKEIDGLRKLLNAYTENPAMGDAEEINENIIEAQRALATLELNRLRYMTSIAVITKVIGDADVGQRHNLVRASFTIPVSCDYCQEKIWGMTKTGFSCKDCGYNCHAKCELKVPPQCSKAKPKEYRKTIVVELTPTSQSFDRSPSASMRSVNSAAPPAKPPPITGSNLKLNSSLAKETKNSSTSSLGSANVANSISNSKSSRALYSYQALNMDELTIKEGDVINVISDEGDGWVMAELNGKKGVVPMSYLSTSDAGPAKGSSNMRSRSSLSHPNIERKELVRVLFDYDAQSDVEISIKKGDIIEVTNRYEEGWWEGVLNGKQGEFPCTYVEPYDGN